MSDSNRTSKDVAQGPWWTPTVQVERLMLRCKDAKTATVEISAKVLEGLLHDSLLWRQDRLQQPVETSRPLDAEFFDALDRCDTHEPLQVYDSNSWRRVGLASQYKEVVYPERQRTDGHLNIANTGVLRAMVAAFNAMLARRPAVEPSPERRCVCGLAAIPEGELRVEVGPTTHRLAGPCFQTSREKAPCERCEGSGRLTIYDTAMYPGQACSPIGDEPCPACQPENGKGDGQ